MWHSIQEYCKKINRQLTFVDITSVSVTLIFLIILVVLLQKGKQQNWSEVVYKEGVSGTVSPQGDKQTREVSQPFGSKSGKTYTFSWCQGSTRILAKNKIYFSSTIEAENSGRTLSKLCQK